MLDPVDLHRIADFVCGAGTPGERTATAAWVRSIPDREAAAAELSRMLGASPSRIPRSDTRTALGRLRRDTGLRTTSETGADVGRQPSAPRDAPHVRVSSWASRTQPAPPRSRPAVAAAVLVIAGVVGVAAIRGLSIQPVASTGPTYVAAVGERVSITLSDGTQVQLAPASRLQVAADYGTVHRTVTLEGEAFFKVVHDRRVPFVVRAANAVVTDVGTSFDVRAYAEESRVRVAVSDGQVSLARAGSGSGRGLGPRDVAALDCDGTTNVTRIADSTPFTGWTTGDLEYRDTPVRIVMADLRRWYAIDTHLPNAGLADRRITARFGPGESVDQISAVLQDLLGARITVQAAEDRAAGNSPMSLPAGRTITCAHN